MGFSVRRCIGGESGKWFERLDADRKITVPFTFETKASGIGDETFHPCVWYERSVTVPNEAAGKRILLHFQAVDYAATLWVNGRRIGTHEGGYAAFSFDITEAVELGRENRITVRAMDSNSCMQPRGKQRWMKDSFGCWYVQTTGIWQTVWMEYVNPVHIRRVKITPDLERGRRTSVMNWGIQGFVTTE